MPIEKWNQQAIIDAALKKEEQRMLKAAALVQRNVKTKLNVKGTEKNVSAPGEPPRKQSGRLYDSIFFKVEREGNSVVGIVYSNDVKARRLEFGFVGKDKLGRVYDQAPRPFMRPALSESKDSIKKILGGVA